tara:strand:- start:30 stop:554 length:525 start_codon:yes stop_codon:yes gene_type:complete
MKSILIKIIFSFCIVFFINACHTFEHQNIFNQNLTKNSNVEVLNKKNKFSKFAIDKSTNNSEMAPIEMPKQTETVQKLALQKKVEIPNANQFSLDKFINWNEEKLIKSLGKSHFVKEEGKLKNYQYHFKECFIDVFLLKKNKVYIVNYIEKRPTKLNGTINIKACVKEIKQIMN